MVVRKWWEEMELGRGHGGEAGRSHSCQWYQLQEGRASRFYALNSIDARRTVSLLQNPGERFGPSGSSGVGRFEDAHRARSVAATFHLDALSLRPWLPDLSTPSS